MDGFIIFIDNGVSGTIGMRSTSGICEFFEVPTYTEQYYTKAKKNINLLDVDRIRSMINDLRDRFPDSWIRVYMERPMVNATRFFASVSAVVCHYMYVQIFKDLKVPYEIVDSKEWQKEMLPHGIKGSAEQKKASMDAGLRLFPQFEKLIRKHKDADGILGAEFFYRRNNRTV